MEIFIDYLCAAFQVNKIQQAKSTYKPVLYDFKLLSNYVMNIELIVALYNH